MSKTAISISLRQPDQAALAAINHVIEDAITGWQLADRVKRLVLPSYRYTALDVSHLIFATAQDQHGNVVGLAAWQPDDAMSRASDRSLLLHGLFVTRAWQGQGVGTRLLNEVYRAAIRSGYQGVLVKAQRDAEGFFNALGFEPLAVIDPQRDYEHRLWKRLDQDEDRSRTATTD